MWGWSLEWNGSCSRIGERGDGAAFMQRLYCLGCLCRGHIDRDNAGKSVTHIKVHADGGTRWEGTWVKGLDCCIGLYW